MEKLPGCKKSNKHNLIISNLSNEPKPLKMNLQLFVQDRLIASLPIDNSFMSNPLYLSSVKKELEEKYREIIEKSQSTPTFLLNQNS